MSCDPCVVKLDLYCNLSAKKTQIWKSELDLKQV